MEEKSKVPLKKKANKEVVVDLEVDLDLEKEAQSNKWQDYESWNFHCNLWSDGGWICKINEKTRYVHNTKKKKKDLDLNLIETLI